MTDHSKSDVSDLVRVRVMSVPAKQLPPQNALNRLLRYDGGTGALFWMPRSPEIMETNDPRGKEWAARAWNAVNAGKEALNCVNRGYRHGKINGVHYLAHRVIWKMVYGADPDTIDHINGKRSDNRIVNLRDCTNAENCRNYEKPHGSSKYRGVSWVTRDRVWVAQISYGLGRKRRLGNHKSEVQAAIAYDDAAIELHGEFAVLNFPERRILACLTARKENK